MTSVGIVGGSGYMGGEALRVLLKHPRAKIAWATSRTPGPVEHVHPNLYDTGLKFERLEDVETPDFVMLALPTSATASVASRFLSAGARVIVSYASANRDERHFEDPERFDIRRARADHLAFGAGNHGCAGQGLARLEAHAVFLALAARVRRLELTGVPERQLNNITRGFAHIPARAVS